MDLDLVVQLGDPEFRDTYGIEEGGAHALAAAGDAAGLAQLLAAEPEKELAAHIEHDP